MRTITDVIVKGISLVTKGNTPAVQHAEAKFAIFKIFSKKPNATQLEKLNKIEARLTSIANDIETASLSDTTPLSIS